MKAKEFKKFFVVLGLCLVLMSSFLTKGASASVLDGTNFVQANAASKYVTVMSYEVKNPHPYDYWYDDGMYRGYLQLVYYVTEDGNDRVDYYALGGTVYCYKSCAISNIKNDDK